MILEDLALPGVEGGSRMRGVRVLLSITVIVMMVFGYWSVPQAQKMQCEQRFEMLDTDHDGQVTKDEFMSVGHRQGDAEELFTQRDADANGVLTKEEFCAHPGRGHGPGYGKGQGMRKDNMQ